MKLFLSFCSLLNSLLLLKSILLLCVGARGNEQDDVQKIKPNTPILESHARVAHLGDHLLKFVVFWNEDPNAIEYETSINDRLRKTSGRTPCDDSKRTPCLAVNGAHRGPTRVMVRVRISSSPGSTSESEEELWSDWSEQATWMVDDSHFGLKKQLPTGDEGAEL